MNSGFDAPIRAFSLGKRAAAEQGGLLSGQDPTKFNPTDPIRLWIVQLGIIMLMTQILAFGLKKIKQPKVIAEVLGGILLGPTAFGAIPGFTEHIFPNESRSYLSLTANIGLCLFLFLVGLEIEGANIKRNAKLSAIVALAGMALPFGFGAALAVPIYKQYIDESVKFTNFMLFTGVAYSITAFPVLCRILVELNLLETTVGIVVLSAGVANDILGWTLLALAIGLVNGGGGLTALYILLTCIAFTIFLLFAVRRGVHWIARQTGSIESGPTLFFMTFVIMLVFGCAFFTDIIGVHAIFGAFLAGLIVPRDGGLAIKLTEKLEDMVGVIFLPLYFTLSGLSTNLRLLDDGLTWGYTIGIIGLAYIGKFGGCTLAARYAARFNWRESATIGSLMSCKGLIELIVLNVGLQAGILSPKVFSMFVLEALVLTFCTTPAVVALYPPQFRVRAVGAGGNFGAVTHGDEEGESVEVGESSTDEDGFKTRFTVVLDKTAHIPGMMAITQLIQSPSSAATSRVSAEEEKPKSEVSVEALRLIELTDHVFSGVMKSNVAESLLHTDPLLGIFRTFAELHDVPITTSLAIVRSESFASSISEHAKANRSQLVVVPWLPPVQSHDTDHAQEIPRTPGAQPTSNVFESFFKTHSDEVQPSSVHAHFVRSVFAQAPCDTALFVDRGHAPGETRTARSRHHLVVPFSGGPDDRLALDLAVQLCADVRVTATIIRVVKRDIDASNVEKPEQAHLSVPGGNNNLTIHSTAGFPDTVYGAPTTETRIQSETADNLAWSRYADATTDEPRSSRMNDALSRVTFAHIASPTPLHNVLNKVDEELQTHIDRGTRVLLIAGRSRRLAAESHGGELKDVMEEHGTVALGNEVRKTIGDVASAFVATRSHVGMIVVQAALTGNSA